MKGFVVLTFLCVLHNIVHLSHSIHLRTKNCPSPFLVDEFKTTYVNFSYDWDSLAVYTYPNTKSVNIYLDRLSINFLYDFRNCEQPNQTDIMNGIVVLGAGNRQKGNMFDCVFYFVNAETNATFEILVGNKSLSDDCLDKELCLSFIRGINNEHFERAKLQPRDFGSISLLSPGFIKKHPKLHSPCSDTEVPVIYTGCTIQENVKNHLINESKGIINFYDYNSNQNIAISGTTEYKITDLSASYFNETYWKFDYILNLVNLMMEYKPNLKIICSSCAPNLTKVTMNFKDVKFEVSAALVLESNKCKNILYKFKPTGKPTVQNYVTNVYNNHINVDSSEVDAVNEKILHYIENKFKNLTRDVIEKYNCLSILGAQP